MIFFLTLAFRALTCCLQAGYNKILSKKVCVRDCDCGEGAL
jgi:hypothetical protein